MRKFTVAALEEYGYKVLEAGEANEAMAVSERHPGPVHLLLTDVVMPGLNGPELAERLTVLRPEMKVLYVSGYTERAVLQRGLLDLTTAYIQKPFSPAAVAAKVRQTLSKGESRKSILVVDDNPSVRRLLASVLEAGGYAVIEASNGKEALARLESQRVDLVATDLIMPEQEGLETIQVLHQRNPEIKIVAISGAFHGQFLPVARFFGAHATLQKPVEPEKLLETVRSLLS